MEDNRPRYNTVCWKCGHEMYSCKSLGMEIGWSDTGFGSCTKCDARMAMNYNEETNEMDTYDWQIYIDKVKAETEKAGAKNK